MAPPEPPAAPPVDPLSPTSAEVTADTVAGSEPRATGPGAAAPELAGYQLGELIGRGGMGEVMLARDRRIGRDVAIKRMRAAAPSPELVDRFLREAKIQARLDHPAIAPVHELGYDALGRPFFTMKRVAGTTLAALMSAGTATPQRLLRALIDVCLAVELAHSRGVIHRDLKPANIMLGDYGEVYVLDWGVARVLPGTLGGEGADEVAAGGPAFTEDLHSLDGETREGALLGTPGYMAPEQARGEPVGPAADVYALGAILFEILAGAPLHPPGGSAIPSTLAGERLSPATRRPERSIPPELDAACLAALAMDPDARPSARGLADTIQGYLDGDRDLERRRLRAAELMVSARSALAAEEEAEALNAAGNAAILDPSSSDASRFLVELLVDGRRAPPPEAAVAIREAEDRLSRERSRRALRPFLSLFSLLPLLPFMHVISWPTLLALFGGITTMAGILWINTRRLLPITVTLTAHLVVVILVSRIAGPFVLTPILVCAVLLTATSLPVLLERPLLVVAWTLFAALGPLALEWAGVLAPSWAITAAGLVSHGTLFASGETVDATLLVIGNVAAILVMAGFGRSIGAEHRQTQRRVILQAWRLRQLLPHAARVGP